MASGAIPLGLGIWERTISSLVDTCCRPSSIPAKGCERSLSESSTIGKYPPDRCFWPSHARRAGQRTNHHREVGHCLGQGRGYWQIVQYPKLPYCSQSLPPGRCVADRQIHLGQTRSGFCCSQVIEVRRLIVRRSQDSLEK